MVPCATITAEGRAACDSRRLARATVGWSTVLLAGDVELGGVRLSTSSPRTLTSSAAAARTSAPSWCRGGQGLREHHLAAAIRLHAVPALRPAASRPRA